MTQNKGQETLNKNSQKQKVVPLEPPISPYSQSTTGAKNKKTLIASIIAILPVLGLGSISYYFANRLINEEIRQSSNLGIRELIIVKKQQQEQLLSILGLSTGATAILTAGLVGFWTRKTINSAEQNSTENTLFSGEKAQKERTQLLTETIGYIRNFFQEKDILEAAVEEVRRILECDRVVVYSREADTKGVVVAESVDPRWPRTLGRKIDDPCFDARYDEKYQNGRVRAIDNIDKSGMTKCYVDQLKKIKVKANLVAPILNEGKLSGLLVAHQCDRPRTWQQSEVDFVAQIASQVGFAIDNARVSASLAEVKQQLETESQWTEFFTDSIQYIRASLKEEDVLNAIVREVRQVLSCDRVVVYGLEPANRALIIAESVAPRWPKTLGRKIDDPCFDAKYDQEYQNGRVRAIENIHQANMTDCYIEQLDKIAVKANLVAPILNEGKLLGLLVAHQCDAPRKWQEIEIRWFAQMAAQVGFAIDNARVLANSASIEEQAQTEAEWTQFFTDSIQYIRASLKEEDILATAVKEVQKVIESDRVVVYGLEADNRGIIIAESVDPRWPRTLGRKIDDPCFDAKYDQEYQNGRVRAIENIHQANMTDCYIEQLDKIAVKANLVAPILNEGKLLGLLVAHQCSAPRKWQEIEIRWFAQMAAQIGFAIDNARVLANSASIEEQARTEAEWAQFLTNAIRHIRASLKEEDILETAVTEVQKVIESDRVVVYGLEANNRGIIIAESVDPRWPRTLGRKIDDPCFDAKYDQEYQNGRVRAIDNILEAGMTLCYIEQLDSIGVKANLVAPILNQGKLLGLLVAHQCSAPRKWQEFEINWFAQIAAQIGFAIDNARVLASFSAMQKQVEAISQEATIATREGYLLQAELPKLLAEDQIVDAKKFIQDVQRQEAAITEVWGQIQQLLNSAQSLAANVEQLDTQSGVEIEALEPIQGGIDRMAELTTTIEATSERLKNLNHFFSQVSEVEKLVGDLTARVNEQTINLIVEVGRGKDADRQSIVSMAEIIHSSSQELTGITGDIQPIIEQIETETKAIGAAIETFRERALQETELLTETQSQLTKINNLKDRDLLALSEIAETTTNQTFNANKANESLQELANLARVTSEKSAIVGDYLDKLESVARNTEANNLEPPKS
ncbi:MAG: GAF domain-containing protein [Prochloraceae cyanobacterium]|nr:GAF domain-containing protein [Prochloraceae cyanobacterium]